MVRIILKAQIPKRKMEIIKRREEEESWKMNSIMQYLMIKYKNGNICFKIRKI